MSLCDVSKQCTSTQFKALMSILLTYYPTFILSNFWEFRVSSTNYLLVHVFFTLFNCLHGNVLIFSGKIRCWLIVTMKGLIKRVFSFTVSSSVGEAPFSSKNSTMSLWPPRAARRSGLHRTPCETEQNVWNVGSGYRGKCNLSWQAREICTISRKRGDKHGKNVSCDKRGKHVQSVGSAGKNVTCDKRGKHLHSVASADTSAGKM